MWQDCPVVTSTEIKHYKLVPYPLYQSKPIIIEIFNV